MKLQSKQYYMRKQKKPNRYFIVGYIGTHTENNAKITGERSFSVSNGGFLPKRRIYDIIQGDVSIKDIVITFIIEISESDYREWNS